MTKQDLILDALIEINAMSAGDLPQPETLTFASGKLDRIYDNWNAQDAASWATSLSTFTLTPNLQPHTIGPYGATWTAAQRPVTIIGANILIGAGPTLVKSPLTLRDDDWWLSQRSPNVLTSLPTDLYYSADWPVGSTPVAGTTTTPNANGSLFLWPVPTIAYGIEFLSPTILAAITLLQLFFLPPGYRDALTLTLAEDLSVPLTGHGASATLATKAAAARARIFANNDSDAKISTADSGMPGTTRGVEGNYMTGWMR